MNVLSVPSLKAKINKKVSQVSVLTKIFIWSVLFEPLIFFHIVPQHISGVGGGVGRMLQFILLFTLIFKLLIAGKIIFPKPFSLVYRKFTFFFLLAIFAGVLGYLYGSYSYNLTETFLDLNSLTPYEWSFRKDTSVAIFLQGPYFRPLFEYFIALYYFIYFVVLMQYMLTTKEDIDYFFRCFYFVFVVCLVVGFVDFLLVTFFFPDYRGIPRYIADGVHLEGARWHGIIGEPRDAFNYLIIALSVLTIRDIWLQERKLNYFWLSLIVIASFLTYSFSGVLGIIFAVGLIIIFYFPLVKFKSQLFIIFGLIITLLIVFLNVQYSPRMMLYYDALSSVYYELNTGATLSPVVANVMNNIYPMWHMWLEVREFNFFHLFFGNGFGSASVINNYYLNEIAVINPNSSLIRMIYENGIIGIFLFIFAFLTPLKIFCTDIKMYNKLKFLMLITIAMYFSHRTVGLYIFLGVSLVVLRYKLTELNPNFSFYKG